MVQNNETEIHLSPPRCNCCATVCQSGTIRKKVYQHQNKGLKCNQTNGAVRISSLKIELVVTLFPKYFLTNPKGKQEFQNNF